MHVLMRGRSFCSSSQAFRSSQFKTFKLFELFNTY